MREESSHGSTTASRGPLIHVATRCTSIDEFVEKFATFASEGALVLPASGELAVGTEGRFAILLRDRSVAMRGRCRVTDAKPAPASANGPAVRRTMLRVALLEMDEATQAIHRRLLASQRPPVPLPVAHSVTERTEVSPPRDVVPPPIAVRPVVPPPIAVRPTVPPPMMIKPAVPSPAAASPVVAPPVAVRPVTAPPIAINPVAPPPVAAKPVTTPIAPPPVAVNPVGAPVRTVTPVRGGAASAALSRARAHTLIGVARPTTSGTATRDALEVTSMGESAHEAPTAVTPQRVVEIRVPGASFTLPANPLSELGSEDLASFIDCTLFEAETEEVEARLDDDSGPTREMRPPEAPPPAAAPPRPPAREKRPGRLPAPLAGLVARLPAPLAGLVARLPEPVRKLGPRVGLGALLVVVGVALGIALRKPSPAGPRSSAAPASAVSSAPAPAPAAIAPAPPVADHRAPEVVDKVPAKVVEDAPKIADKVAPKVVDKVAPKVAAKPAHPASTPGGACSARIVTQPDDAKVFWGDKLLGRSPIESAGVPCGAGKVTFQRDRYQSATQEVNAEPGAAVEVSQRLHRPSATLVVGSSPPHAEVTVNGQPQGPAPRKVNVSRFESVSIQVSLPGYAPWKKNVYVRQPETRIGMQLTPAGHDAGKRPAGR